MIYILIALTLLLLLGAGLVRTAVENQDVSLGLVGIIIIMLSTIGLTQLYHFLHGCPLN